MHFSILWLHLHRDCPLGQNFSNNSVIKIFKGIPTSLYSFPFFVNMQNSFVNIPFYCKCKIILCSSFVKYHHCFERHNNTKALWQCTKKWSFPLRISSVNVTKSAVSCGFGHIYWRNPIIENFIFCAVQYLSRVSKNRYKDVTKMQIIPNRWMITWRLMCNIRNVNFIKLQCLKGVNSLNELKSNHVSRVVRKSAFHFISFQ